MSQIFRKEIHNNTAASEEELKSTIRVIRPVYWMILVGGLLILSVIGFFMVTSTNTVTTTIMGVFHPGSTEYGEIICFPPLSIGKQLDDGMEALVTIPAYNPSKYGHLTGIITYTEPYVATDQEMLELLENQSLAASFYQNAPATCIIIKLGENPNSASGYYWNNPNGNSLAVKDGMLVNVSVITAVDNSFSIIR